MDDASFSPDPTMTGGNGDMGMDQGGMDPMGGQDMGGNANMGMDQGGMDPMGGQDIGGSDNPLVQAITQKAQELSDKDLQTLYSYEESLKADDAMADNGGGDGQEQPMMEQVIFTKKQLNKLQENFGPSQDELMKKKNKKDLPKKQSSSIKNSPFSPPRFQ